MSCECSQGGAADCPDLHQSPLVSLLPLLRRLACPEDCVLDDVQSLLRTFRWVGWIQLTETWNLTQRNYWSPALLLPDHVSPLHSLTANNVMLRPKQWVALSFILAVVVSERNEALAHALAAPVRFVLR